MSILIRKINQAKWHQRDILNGESVSADAITSCLRTKSNSLSTWDISGNALEKGVLAMISRHKHLDTIDVVELNREDLEAENIEIKNSEGDTVLDEFVNKHFDLVKLNYDSLGGISRVIVNAFIAGNVRRFTRSELKTVLQNAVDNGEISREDLKPHVKKHIE